MKIIKVLLVEDNPDYASAVERLLEKKFSANSFQCIFAYACTFKDAKKRIKNDYFDLIYLDGKLDKNKTGLDLVPEIRKSERNMFTPFFLLSTNSFFLSQARKKMNPEMCFLKKNEDLEQIINSDNLETILKKVIQKG